MRAQFEQHLMSQHMEDESPWGMSLMMFQHAQSQHQLYKALVGKQGGSVALAHFQGYLVTLLREHLEMQFAGKKNAQIYPEILALYLVSSFMAILIWWLDHGLQYPAVRMNEIYRQLTQPGMEALLKEN
jgi:hypothetical protein